MIWEVMITSVERRSRPPTSRRRTPGGSSRRVKLASCSAPGQPCDPDIGRRRGARHSSKNPMELGRAQVDSAGERPGGQAAIRLDQSTRSLHERAMTIDLRRPFRITAPAWPKPGGPGVRDRVMQADVARVSMPRRAGRSAIDAGRHHRVPEPTFRLRISSINLRQPDLATGLPRSLGPRRRSRFHRSAEKGGAGPPPRLRPD